MTRRDLRDDAPGAARLRCPDELGESSCAADCCAVFEAPADKFLISFHTRGERPEQSSLQACIVDSVDYMFESMQKCGVPVS
jgi:hypothetical protein